MNVDIVFMYESGMSLSQIAEQIPLSISTVRRRMLDAGVLRSRGDGMRLGVSQGRIGQHMKGLKRGPLSLETRKKMSESRKDWAKVNAKGSRKTVTGYVEITTGEHAGRHQHRVVMESVLGRRLCSHECVHHIDGDRTNNAIENLQVMTREEHSRHHAMENHTGRQRDKLGRYV